MNDKMFKFTSLYNVIAKVSLAVGFCFPGMSQVQTYLHPVLILNSIVSIIPMFYVVACNAIFCYISDLYNTKHHGFTTDAIVTAFDTFYYLLHREEYNSFLSNFDKLTKNIIDLNFVSNHDVKSIINTARTFNSFTKYYVVIVSFIVLSVTIISYILRYVFVRDFLYLEVPYSIKSEYIFHISAILQMVAGFYSYLKTACSRSVMFLVLYHITVYLRALKNSLEDFDSVLKKQQLYNVNVDPKTDNVCRLRSWIELHQNVLRYATTTVSLNSNGHI